MFRRHYVISHATILPTLEANYVQASNVAHDLFERMSKHTIKDNVNNIPEVKLAIQHFSKKFQSLKKELLNLEYRLAVYELCANLDSNVLQEKSLASTIQELAEMPDLKTYLERTKH